jgi:transcriptional regulator with XRE-family HTH domain
MISHAQDTPVFAYRMKAARELLGISQMELGVRAGIDEFTASARINQYERGKHAPDFSTACNLAKVLGVPTAYLYTEDDSLAELIILFGKLKATERREIINFAESMTIEAESRKRK